MDSRVILGIDSSFGVLRQDSQSLPDSSPEFAQFGNHWQTGYPLDLLTYAENYRQGRLAVIYHLHIAVESQVNEGGVTAAEVSRPDSERNAVAVFTSDRFNPADLYLRDNEPVLIRNVEVMYGVDRIPLPSHVRLYLVEEFPAYCDEGCLFWSVGDVRFKSFSFWIDRKVYFPFVGGVRSRQVEPCVIESASEVVQRVAKDQSKIIGDRFSWGDLERFMAGFRVALDGDVVSAVFAKLPDAEVKIVDVLFGPFEF